MVITELLPVGWIPTHHQPVRLERGDYVAYDDGDGSSIARVTESEVITATIQYPCGAEDMVNHLDLVRVQADSGFTEDAWLDLVANVE